MKLEEGKAIIDHAIAQQKLCLVVGHCHVKYKGRAASKLSQGDRLLVIKPDGTFLVHQNSKMAAINYQGPGASISTELKLRENEGQENKEIEEKTTNNKPKNEKKNDVQKSQSNTPSSKPPQIAQTVLIVKAERKKPMDEVIEVAFDSLQSAQSFKLQDDESLKLFGSERQLADLLEQDLGLIEKGLRPLQTESHFNKGAIDILAEDRNGRLVAIELKRRTAGLDAVTQLVRYVKQLSHRKDAAGGKIRGLLCAPEITENALKMLEEEGLEYFKLDYEIAPKATHLDANTHIKGLQKKQKILGEYG